MDLKKPLIPRGQLVGLHEKLALIR
jgi:hypothetical protein